jgi:hypothetical protein
LGSGFGLFGNALQKVQENASYVAGVAQENATYVAGVAHENVSYGAEMAKKKAEETGISDKINQVGVTSALNTVASKASDGMGFVSETAGKVQQSAQEGTLVEKTTKKATDTAYQASSMLSGIGYSLFTQVKSYSGATADEKKEEKKEDG